MHSLTGLPSPTKSPFVQIVQEGLRRSLAKPVKKKEPFTVKMLKAIASDAIEGGSLADLRLAALFAGICRLLQI